MRAVGHVDQVSGTDVVPPQSYPAHPTPVYANRPAHRAPTRPRDSSLRGWPVQLAQWAIIFGALSLLIAGVKWWDRHREAVEAQAAQSSTPAVTATESATVDGR